MVTKDAIEKIRNMKPEIEYPFGNPDELLGRVSKIVVEWVNSEKSAEAAMSGIHTILAQNKRI